MVESNSNRFRDPSVFKTVLGPAQITLHDWCVWRDSNPHPERLEPKSSAATNYAICAYNLVPRAGIEPARLAARDFKSLVSTYFTIWA